MRVQSISNWDGDSQACPKEEWIAGGIPLLAARAWLWNVWLQPHIVVANLLSTHCAKEASAQHRSLSLVRRPPCDSRQPDNPDCLPLFLPAYCSGRLVISFCSGAGLADGVHYSGIGKGCGVAQLLVICYIPQ